MVSILAFDSNTTKKLIHKDEVDPANFTEDYPIFYRNRSKKEGQMYENAIDVALENN